MVTIFWNAAPPKFNIPPRFRDTAFFDKGENVVVKIPFTGNPKPRITWSKDGEVIESGAHFSVSKKERHAILVIKDASRLDSGPYSIVGENELGMDSHIIKIQISGEGVVPTGIWALSLVLVTYARSHILRPQKSTN